MKKVKTVRAGLKPAPTKTVGAHLYGRPMAMIAILAIGLVMVSCGGGNTNKQQSGDVTETKTEQATPAKIKNLYDFPDSKIGTSSFDKDYNSAAIEGAEREKILADIPAQIKKGIGNGSGSVVKRSDSYLVGFTFRDIDADAFKKVKEYYKSLGGMIQGENDREIVIQYDWGKLFQCETRKTNRKGKEETDIVVSFTIPYQM